jgi:ATP-dependent Lhr-like helicase
MSAPYPTQMPDDSRLQPAIDYFAARAWQPFGFQIEAWTAYLNGESGLIHAATGTGKTYAAWFGPLLEALANSAATAPDGLRVLWITPMRALAADTVASLQAPLAELGLPWVVEARTGDTSSSARARQRKRLPAALVTTPESLSLLLARPEAAETFAGLRLVVVDEWHELMASKRGVQTELGLARLRAFAPALRTWGLSATMGNLEVALRTLLGVADIETGEVPHGRLIRGAEPKAVVIESIIPAHIERFPWAGHLGLKLLPQVVAIIERGRSALVFTNTRAQTEAWYLALLDARPEWLGRIALHHGSLDRSTREWVEDGLKVGKLRCVVCTASLDLGVDFAPVDHVLQVGSPKGVARLLQRAGRSGHQPGATSRVVCVPTFAFELLEVAAVRDAMAAGHIEARPPIEQPLDVLAQHLVTVALGGGFEAETLYREVRSTAAYRRLTPEAWAWTLDFVSRGGAALNAYADYHRVRLVNGRYIVPDERLAQQHRMSIGTITSDATLQVQYVRGGALGYVDESFLARLQPGDAFTIGGRVVEFVRVREMTAYVRAARRKAGVIPRWYGGSLPLSQSLTEHVRTLLEQARQGIFASAEMQAVRPIFELQAKWSLIPGTDELLIERVRTREGHHLFVFPFGGKLVNEGLAALCAYRLSRWTPITFSLAANDYGFELLAAERAPLEAAIEAGLFATEALEDDVLASLNAGELARRQFREIARVAGLVFPRFPGGQKSAKQLQASSSLLYDVFARYDPDNLLFRQAAREVLERQLEFARMRSILDRVAAGHIRVVDLKRPTPFAFPLIIERVRDSVSSETLADRVAKMQLALEASADKP